MEQKQIQEKPRAQKALPEFRIGPMTEEDAARICDWRYPPPYDKYRWPSWERMKFEEREFGDPDIRERQYASVRDGGGELIGYVQFFPMAGVVRLGLGLRPDCCGLGWGPAFASATAAEAARRAPGAEIDLEVESWNRRAIRAYEKAGFAATDRYDRQSAHGIVSILCMVYMPR
ncbi:GNAT family N-acetyltransferase [Cohnella lubricantis]|uniref:GNAT family N-acetyltransferase n=1 Tax=Cohnella lubricantis TaxID=2163172 RepID=A0A841TEC4_9BACL|nr:GNAT family N-acetyltransferase [Cohnella lubricantis]MBB6676801.1 GNAT family N-acetyltransferase [Cohnella lubricantis]MBP2118111.1 RimJ/RimL family protein N-acetyltransferase [Cohnella lubricantis]